MPIIRKKLKPSDVYPDDIRYDETTEQVQRFVNGAWIDAPESDPRTQTTLPPRITANPACDAAQSVVDALEGQIDSILTAIDNGATVFAIAGLILGLLSFGLFAIFISIALAIGDAMLSAGTTALSEALTPAVYEQLKCIIYCQMNSSGRLKEGGFDQIQTDVASDIGGLAAGIINSMLNLAGEGGINNLASLGTADMSDCSECPACDDDCSFGWVTTTAGNIISTTSTTVVVESTYNASLNRQEIVLSREIADGGAGGCCFVTGYTFDGTGMNYFTVQCNNSSGNYTPVGLCVKAFATWRTLAFTATLTVTTEC